MDGASPGYAANDAGQRPPCLMNTFRTLAIDFDHAEQTPNGLADPHDLRFGEDVIRGGDGADTVFGDEGLIVQDFVMALPVTAEQFTAAAVQRDNWVRDLEDLASDLDYVAFEADFATLSAMIAAGPTMAAGRPTRTTTTCTLATIPLPATVGTTRFTAIRPPSCGPR